MRKKILFFILILFLGPPLSFPQGVRKAVFAGAFYDANPSRLSSQIDSFLEKVTLPVFSCQDLFALIVPHAGYVWSGKVAAHGYKLVKGRDYETVVIIGPSHQYGFEGCSIYLKGGWETPLGVATIDEAFAAGLSKATRFSYIAEAHQEEHSVEVQVPFIQKILPKAKIVPIIMGYPSERTIQVLAEGLVRVLSTKKALVVVSTDMSHYFPKKKANVTDSQTIALVRSLQVPLLIRKVEAGENILCGGGPVAAALVAFQKNKGGKVEILKYADSSTTGGPEDRVVGYFAAGLCRGEQAPQFSLSSEEKTELLNLARNAIHLFVKEQRTLEYETKNPRFLEPRGAFVTLKKKGVLRGCIGFIEPVLPLFQAIVQAAIYAASEDPRFPKVSREELKELEIEISVLTPLKKIQNFKEIQVGKHGLVIAKGDQKGLLLPQVAVEFNWSRETFLEQVCLKAGLPENAWKEGAEIFVFEAIVFH